MNENNLKILSEIIEETTKLYDLYEELYSLDNQKDSLEWIDVLNKIDTTKAQIDDLYNSFATSYKAETNQMRYAISFLKSLKKGLDKDNILTVFEDKTYLILKRIYNEFIKSLNVEKKEFHKNINLLFREEAHHNEINAYLTIALPSFDIQASLRTIEISKNPKLKYTLSFLNSNVDNYLTLTNYEDVPHNFNEETILDTEYYIPEEKKEEFKNIYGILLFVKSINTLIHTNDERIKDYLNSVIRTSFLFMSDTFIDNIIKDFNTTPIYNKLQNLTKYRENDLKEANKISVNLNPETNNILNKIFEISDSIKTAYNYLLELEHHGELNTPQYQNMLIYLKSTIEEEQTYYSYFELFPKEAISVTDYLYELKDKMNFNSVTSNVAKNNNDNELIIMRIINKMNKIVLNDEEYFHKHIDKEDSKICENDYDYDLVKHSIKHYDDLFNYETLRSCHPSNNHEELSFKYNLSYLDSQIEEELLEGRINNLPRIFNNFFITNMSNNNKISFINNKYALIRLSLIIDDILGYDDEIYNVEQEEIYDDNNPDEYSEEFAELFEDLDLDTIQDEEEFDEKQNIFYYNVLLSEFKSCLLFTDNIGLSEIRKRINKKYEHYKYGREEIFNELYSIINNANNLKKEANLDLNNKKNRGQK